MVSDMQLLDEIESWAAEPNAVIFRHVGQRLNDAGLLGFVSPQFAKQEDTDADTVAGEEFFEKRFDDFCSAWPFVDASSEVKFAYFLADMIQHLASPAPIAPLAVLSAREIIARAKKGAKVILGVTEERSHHVSEKKNPNGDKLELAAIWQRADEVVQASKGGRPTDGHVKRAESRIRLEPDNIQWLKSKGPNHLSRINGLLTALREAEEQEAPYPSSE